MKHISKQKMYEMAIVRTYQNCLGPQVELEANQIGGIPDSFAELMILRTLHGFVDNIPSKQPFDKLGFSYIHQLLGMAICIKDDEFMEDLFEFMNSHLKYFDFKSQDQMDICYNLFYDTLTGENCYREFNKNMGDFILKNFDKNLEYYDKTLSLVYALSACNTLTFTELVKLKNETN